MCLATWSSSLSTAKANFSEDAPKFWWQNLSGKLFCRKRGMALNKLGHPNTPRHVFRTGPADLGQEHQHQECTLPWGPRLRLLLLVQADCLAGSSLQLHSSLSAQISCGWCAHWNMQWPSSWLQGPHGCLVSLVVMQLNSLNFMLQICYGIK